MDPERRQFWSLLRDDAVGLLIAMPLIAPAVALAFLFTLAWLPRLGSAAPIGVAVLALLAILPVRRLLALLRLSRAGVEVVARLAEVVDRSVGETDFRTARYQYELGGVTHWFEITATDFFTRRATRYGEDVLLLVDAADPKTALVVRTTRFGDPSRFGP